MPVTFTLGCGDDKPTSPPPDPPPPDPQIAVSPDSLIFGSTDTQFFLGIYNSGGGSVNWSMSITSGAPWLSILPTSGKTTADTSWVKVTVDRGTVQPRGCQLVGALETMVFEEVFVNNKTAHRK